MAVLAQIGTRTGNEPARPYHPAVEMPGRQKAAIIVQLLLSEGADVPLLGLPDHMQAALTEQIGTMRSIDRDTLQGVVEEFCAILERVGLTPQAIARDVVAMVLGSKIPNARPLPADQ